MGALLGPETVGSIVGGLGVGTAVGANVMRQHESMQVRCVSSRQSAGVNAEQIMSLHSLDRCSVVQGVGDADGAAEGVEVIGADDGVGALVGASVQLEPPPPLSRSWYEA